MNLKDYQTDVLNDLDKYLDRALQPGKRLDESFHEFWEEQYVSLQEGDKLLHPYNNLIKGVPRVTAKVPTAGGKTFIACNALKRIFNHLPTDKPKAVVWFVPSDTILEQTYRNLSNPEHDYRKQLNMLFNAAVRVVNKDTALLGKGISLTELRQHLTIFVLSVDSFVESVRGDKLPKAYRENENLTVSETLDTAKGIHIPKADGTSLITYIAKLNPVVIIDESHNFGSDLRVDLLQNINPCFIYELTATPKETSNIISFVDAMKLKNEDMVKLPVIVYNHQSTNDVISSAIALRDQLERQAIEQEQRSGHYIRPIVLFQAQSNIDDESINFEKIKAQLVKANIPEEQIKIKTANKNEIKNTDLMSRDCPVRYIITVNALKEGWDCPFAYILASLANRSSKIDVEQILGRILRQPHTHHYDSMYLNMSYVFTCSAQFGVTIKAILDSLQNSGFSGKDYLKQENYADDTMQDRPSEMDFFKPLNSKEQKSSEPVDNEPEIDVEEIKSQLHHDNGHVEQMMKKAEEAEQEYEEQSKIQQESGNHLPNEVQDIMNDKTYKIRNMFSEDARSVVLPRFVIKVEHSIFFGKEDNYKVLEPGDLMEGFRLTSEDKKIIFETTSSESQMITLDERNKNEWVPMAAETPAVVKNDFFEWFSTLNTSSKVKHLTTKIADSLDRLDGIDKGQITKYVSAVLEEKNNDELTALAQNYLGTVEAFEQKIKLLSLAYRKEKFRDLYDIGKISLQYVWQFPEKITLPTRSPHMTKMLYTEEDYMNNFESEFIGKLASLPNIMYWHKNLRREPGYMMNGFINHWPDFIVKLKSGKVLLIETKGDHLDGSVSAAKVKQGEYLERMDGSGKYKYFMTYKTHGTEGALPVSKLLELIKMM